MDKSKGSVLFVQFTDPSAYPPLQHAAQILEKEGWRDIFICLATPKTEDIQFESIQKGEFHWVLSSPSRFLRWFIYVWFCLRALFLVETKKIDWIYGSDFWSLPVLYFGKIFLNKKIVYHEHDSLNGSRSFLVGQILKLRKEIIFLADIKIVPARKRIPPDLDPESWEEVNNCPSRQEVLPFAEKRKDALVVYYHGSINSERLPFQLFEAFKKLPFPFIFNFAGYDTGATGGYVPEIIQWAEKNKLKGQINYLGVLPTRKELLRVGLEAHVGLALMPQTSHDINMMHMCGASNKPYDYLVSGCALLVSNLPDWRETYVQTGFGLSCDADSSDSIANTFKWFYENLDQTIEMGKRGREKVIEEWNYEKEFEPILKKLSV